MAVMSNSASLSIRPNARHLSALHRIDHRNISQPVASQSRISHYHSYIDINNCPPTIFLVHRAIPKSFTPTASSHLSHLPTNTLLFLSYADIGSRVWSESDQHSAHGSANNV